MADNDNSMQAQLGLFSAASSATPIAFPTPAPPPMAVRHPGEMSQLSVAMAQSQAASTIQTVVTPRITPGPGMGGGGFGQQFGANMASLNSQMFNPYVAQTMANVGGFGGSGFMPGMLPSPVNMTSPNMGIFRNAPQNFAPTFPPTPPMPLIPFPGISPTLPAPSFRTPTDFGYDQARYRGMQQTAAFVAAPGVAVRGMTDFAGSEIGAGLGAFIGHRFGGMRGAGIGGTVGALAGLIGSEAGGFGEASQRIVDRFNPLRTIYNQAQQLQTGSVGYVSGGSDLEVNGRGLGSAASRHLAVGLRQFSRQMPSSGDSFTNTDMLKMTQMAGDVGLLNMSQSSDQIVSQMKTVAKSLKVFMQLAGEPDMRAAMKSMGQLYAMGLTAPEIVQTAQNAKMFSRMAGTTVQGIMEAGQTGAAVFQSNGLTAGLGMNVGMGALGMATSAVAGGAYSPQLLALQGGVHGIAQREMMAQAATLKMPMLTAAASSFGNGGFGANGRGLGGMNLHQMTTAGANNLIDAVSKGGVGALGMYQLQEPMLQDQIGRQLGPLGMKNQQFQNVLQTMKMLGLSGQGGFATTAQSLYGKEIATDLVSQGSNPEFFANMQRQIEVQRNDLRGQAKKQLDDRRPSFLERATGVKALGKQSWFRRGTEGFYDMLEDFGNAVDFTQENAAEANGQALTRTPTRLLMSSDERAQASRLSGQGLVREMNAVMSDATSGPYRNRSNIGFSARGGAWGSTWSGFKDSDLKDNYNRVKGSTFLESLRNLGTSREEMEAAVEGADRSGRIFMQGKTATDKEYLKLTEGLSKAGIDGSLRDEFTASLLATSRSGETQQGSYRDVAKGLAAKRGITLTDAQADDMYRAQAGQLDAMAGDEGAAAFAPQLAGAGRGHLNFMETARQRRTNFVQNVTGTTNERDAEKAMEILNKSGDPDVAAYAALSFIGKANEFLETLPKDRKFKVKATGDAVAKELKTRPELHDAVKGYANTLTSMATASKGKIGDVAREIADKSLETKAVADVRLQLEKAGVDESILTGAKDLGEVLDMVAKTPGGASAEIKAAAAERAAAAGDPDTQARVDAKFASRLMAKGSSTGTSMTGGVMSDGEGALDWVSSLFGETAGETRAIFKDGKNPLVNSAASLDYAATKLIEAAGKLGGGS